MLYYFSKNFTAAASGRIVKQVDCEKCRGRFFYELARVASASASAPYAIGQSWAQSRAQNAANRKLARMLQRDSELVACPHCGHMQQSMLANERRRMHPAMRFLAWLVPIIGLPLIGVIALISWSAHPRRFPDENHDAYFIAAGICVAVSIFLFLARRFLVTRLGQKGNEHLLRAAMQGAPPPLLADQQSAADGQVHLHPAPPLSSPTDAIKEPWVVFPLLRIAMPPVCCECLQPCTTIYKSLMGERAEDSVKVPICPTCMRKAKARGWRGFAMILLMTLSAGALVAIFPNKMDLFGRAMIALLFGAFGSLALAIIFPSLLSPPFVCKIVNEHRAVVRLWFRNPQYTQLLQHLIKEMERQAETVEVAQRA